MLSEELVSFADYFNLCKDGGAEIPAAGCEQFALTFLQLASQADHLERLVNDLERRLAPPAASLPPGADGSQIDGVKVVDIRSARESRHG